MRPTYRIGSLGPSIVWHPRPLENHHPFRDDGSNLGSPATTIPGFPSWARSATNSSSDWARTGSWPTRSAESGLDPGRPGFPQAGGDRPTLPRGRPRPAARRLRRRPERHLDLRREGQPIRRVQALLPVGGQGRGRILAGGPADEPADGELLHHLGVLRPAVRTRQRDDRDLPARRGRTSRAGGGSDRGDSAHVRDQDGHLRARRDQGRSVRAEGVDHGRRVRVLRPGGVSGRRANSGSCGSARRSGRWIITSPSRRPTS